MFEKKVKAQLLLLTEDAPLANALFDRFYYFLKGYSNLNEDMPVDIVAKAIFDYASARVAETLRMQGEEISSDFKLDRNFVIQAKKEEAMLKKTEGKK